MLQALWNFLLYMTISSINYSIFSSSTRKTGKKTATPTLRYLDRILDLLREATSRFCSKIAGQVRYSHSACQRIRRPDSIGVIRQRPAWLDAENLGFGPIAFVMPKVVEYSAQLSCVMAWPSQRHPRTAPSCPVRPGGIARVRSTPLP